MLYFDENNQYGRALKRPLPVGNYCWMIRPTAKALKEIMCEKKRREDDGQRVVDFFGCVDLELPDDCSPEDRQCEEEFNLLVANDTPNAFKFSEQQTRTVRSTRQEDRQNKVQVAEQETDVGEERHNNYWLHSSLLGMALANGWRITRVRNAVMFVGRALIGAYVQYNQDMRQHWIGEGLDFRATFHKLMNNSLYGWFCRAEERYKKTELLFSGEDSYRHFEEDCVATCSGLPCASLQEKAQLINNPHDDVEEKKNKICRLFDAAKDTAQRFLKHYDDDDNDYREEEEEEEEGDEGERKKKKKKKKKEKQRLQRYVGSMDDACNESIRWLESEVKCEEHSEAERKRRLLGIGKDVLHDPGEETTRDQIQTVVSTRDRSE